MKRRDLTPEEKKLWELVTRQTVPLDEKVKTSPPPIGGRPGGGRNKGSFPSNAPHLTSPLRGEELPRGTYANIDRNTAEKFRKGKFEIDATLDLHGFTRDNAFTALVRFLRSQHERRSRCLLVITGKGLVLREELPRWLADDEFRGMILAFDAAKQKHGGSGAFYILLRRKR